jgi:hypothetical protein
MEETDGQDRNAGSSMPQLHTSSEGGSTKSPRSTASRRSIPPRHHSANVTLGVASQIPLSAHSYVRGTPSRRNWNEGRLQTQVHKAMDIESKRMGPIIHGGFR